MNKLKTAFIYIVELVKNWKKLSMLTLLILVALSYSIFSGSGVVIPKTTEIVMGNIEQSVSVTGRVEAAENVELSFDKSGKISNVYMKVGDTIRIGQVVASIDSSELLAQRKNYSSSVQSAQAKYNQTMAGASLDDLRVLQAGLNSSSTTLAEFRAGTAKDLITNSVAIAVNSLVTLSEIQSDYQSYNFAPSYSDLISKRSIAMQSIYGLQNLGSTAPFYYTALKPVFLTKLDEINLLKNDSGVDQLLADTRVAVDLVKIVMDEGFNNINQVLIPATSTDKTKLATARSNVSTQLSTISAQQQVLVGYVNAVNAAQAQLDQKKSPASLFDIEISKAQLDQAEANLSLVDAQLAKNKLTSPIAGTLASLDLKIGELSTPGKSVATIIGTSGFQVTANIPEADIAKIVLGNNASITLDAYGQDIEWQAKIAMIYQSEKIIDGVSTYKTILQFDAPDDRIRSGMTANIDVSNQAKNDVLIVPQRSIITKDGIKSVKLYVEEDNLGDRYANYQVDVKNNKFTQFLVPIRTGLRGSNGEIEVLSGLELGDRVVIE